MKNRHVSKATIRRFCFVLTLAFISFLFFEAVLPKSTDSMQRHRKFSDEDIIIDVRELFHHRRRTKHVFMDSYETRPNKLLPNPDRRLHSIKENKPMAIGNASVWGNSMVENKNPSGSFWFVRRFDSVKKSFSGVSILSNYIGKQTMMASYVLEPVKVKAKSSTRKKSKEQCFKPPGSNQRWKMVILVKSLTANADTRDAIRDTFGSVAEFDGVEIQLIFLLAKAPSLYLQYKVSLESKTYGDILEVNVDESVKYFTHITISGMQWMSQNFPPDYILATTDENTGISINNVINYISYFVKNFMSVEDDSCSFKSIFPFICGFKIRKQGKPIRDSNSPWYVSKEVYPSDLYPAHCQGSFYLTSVSTVNLILDVAKRTNSIQLDTVWITGILRQKLGLGEEFIKSAESTSLYMPLVHFFRENIAESVIRVWKESVPKMRNHNIVFKEKQTL